MLFEIDLLQFKTKTAPIADRTILSTISEMLPAELLDPLITSLPAPDRVNYSSINDIEEEEVEEEE